MDNPEQCSETFNCNKPELLGRYMIIDEACLHHCTSNRVIRVNCMRLTELKLWKDEHKVMAFTFTYIFPFISCIIFIVNLEFIRFYKFLIPFKCLTYNLSRSWHLVKITHSCCKYIIITPTIILPWSNIWAIIGLLWLIKVIYLRKIKIVIEISWPSRGKASNVIYLLCYMSLEEVGEDELIPDWQMCGWSFKNWSSRN